MANRGKGFSYAAGPYREVMLPVASAFSAGNVVELTSVSSISGTNLTLANEFAAVAITDSDKSLGGQVPCVLIQTGTEFWASTATNVASTYTVGSSWDFIASGGNHILHSSATTARVVIAPGGNQANIDQSDESRVKVFFLGSGAELDFI